MQQNVFLRKLSLILKFLTSQMGNKELNTHIAQDSQFSNHIWLVFKSCAENEVGRLVRDLSLYFKKAFFKVWASSQQLRFKIV